MDFVQPAQRTCTIRIFSRVLVLDLDTLTPVFLWLVELWDMDDGQKSKAVKTDGFASNPHACSKQKGGVSPSVQLLLETGGF